MVAPPVSLAPKGGSRLFETSHRGAWIDAGTGACSDDEELAEVDYGMCGGMSWDFQFCVSPCSAYIR